MKIPTETVWIVCASMPVECLPFFDPETRRWVAIDEGGRMRAEGLEGVGVSFNYGTFPASGGQMPGWFFRSRRGCLRHCLIDAEHTLKSFADGSYIVWQEDMRKRFSDRCDQIRAELNAKPLP